MTTDAMGSVTGILDEEGTVIERRSYETFGEIQYMMPDGTQHATSPTAVDVGFQGQIRDEVAGIYQMGFRWYSTVMGRWLSRDPIGLEGGTNLLLFANNNPAVLSDFLGLLSAEITINFKSAIGADLSDPLQHEFEIPTTSCEAAEAVSNKKKYMKEVKKAAEEAKNVVMEKIDKTLKGLKGQSTSALENFLKSIIRTDFFNESDRKAYCTVSIKIDGLVQCVGTPPKDCRINVQIHETTRNGSNPSVSAAMDHNTSTFYIISESEKLTAALVAAEQRALDKAIAEFNAQMDACTKK